MANLRNWLRRAPSPVKVQVDDRTVLVGEGRSKWAELESTILTMQPKRLVLLDADGNILRTTELDGTDEVADPADATKDTRSDLVQLADLISKAHDSGAARHAAAYELAFTKQVELVQILAERLAGLEEAWMKLLGQHAELMGKLAEAAEGGDEAGLVGSMMELAAAKAKAKAGAETGKPNGKPKGKEAS